MPIRANNIALLPNLAYGQLGHEEYVCTGILRGPFVGSKHPPPLSRRSRFAHVVDLVLPSRFTPLPSSVFPTSPWSCFESVSRRAALLQQCFAAAAALSLSLSLVRGVSSHPTPLCKITPRLCFGCCRGYHRVHVFSTAFPPRREHRPHFEGACTYIQDSTRIDSIFIALEPRAQVGFLIVPLSF